MTLQSAELGRLHDGTLVAVRADWASGEVRIQVRLSEGLAPSAEIVVARATVLRCAWEQPWGPSASINEVRLLRLTEGRIRIEIEMQSGDVIEIEGAHVEFNLGG